MKATSTTLFATLMLVAISCTKETLRTPSSTSAQTNENAEIKTGHYLGERFGGGVIFWMTKDGLHGLIADTADLGLTTWWNGTYTTSGAKGTVTGTGCANTVKIILSQGKSGRYAALGCARYKGSGYADWFLPSQDELNELYKQKDVVGGFVGNSYWSSSEINDENAWIQSFDFGGQYGANKGAVDYVRAIRAF